MRKWGGVALAVALAVGLSACSSSSNSSSNSAGNGASSSTASGSGSTSVKAACELFTAEMAAAALGGPVNPGVQTQPNPKQTVCKYTRTDGAAFGNVSSGTWSVIDNQSLGATPIPGLGDEAYGKDPFGISVRKGSNGFNVNLTMAVGDFTGTAAEAQAAANMAANQAAAQQILANW